MKKVYKEQDQYDIDHHMVFVEFVENRNMANRKPYRTKNQKAMARATAVKCNDGTWRSTAPVSHH